MSHVTMERNGEQAAVHADSVEIMESQGWKRVTKKAAPKKAEKKSSEQDKPE